MPAESYTEQRTRILRAFPETSPFDFDSAVILGYPPESWDGMWKLPARWPIIWLTRNWAIVREVRSAPVTHKALRKRNGKRRIRWILKRAPKGDRR